MDVDSLDKALLAKALNYHGLQLQNIFERDFPHFKVLKLDNLNYNEYTKRQKQFSFQDRSKRLRLQQFICKYADKLFNKNIIIPEEIPVRRTTDSALYPILPPFEWFSSVDKELRSQIFFDSVQVGDIIGATIISKTSPGIILRVLYAESYEIRCVSDIGIKAFCPTSALIPAVDKKTSTSRAFLLNDSVCCEILEVNPDTEKLVCGMKGVCCEAENKARLGLLISEDFPLVFKKFLEKKKESYSDLLEKSESFYNPDFVNNLLSHLGIPNELLSHFNYLKDKFPPNEYANELRIVQASRWSFRNVAEGIEHFKAQRYTEAFQCLNQALTIDPRNIEALVARGALYANSASYAKAICDFESAMKLNPNHQNAKKYMGDTLIARGRAYEEDGKYAEALKSYECCLKLIPSHEEARNSVQFIKNKLLADSKKVTEEENALTKKNEEINSTLTQLLSQTNEKHLLREIKKLKKKRVVTSSSSSSSSNTSSDSSDESDSSSSSSEYRKKKKKSKKEHSLSPLSKRMAQMESVAGDGAVLPSANHNASVFHPSTIPYTQETPMPFYKPPVENENEYELRVKTFLEETKRDDDYEEKVRKFLEETAKWKKKHDQKKGKSKKKRKKEKLKSKKHKKDSKKKKKREEKKHKKRSTENSDHNDAIPEKYLNADHLGDFDDLESKLSDYYSKVEKASSKSEKKDKHEENSKNTSQEQESKFESDDHDVSTRSINKPESESFEDDSLPGKIELGMIKFKMQMPTAQNKLQKRIGEDAFWEEEKAITDEEMEESSSKKLSTELEQIQLPLPGVVRPAESPGPLDKLRGFHTKKLDSPHSKRSGGRGRSRSRSRSRDRRHRYRSKSSSRKRYRSRSRSRSGSYRRGRHSRYSRSSSYSRSRSQSRSRSRSPYGRRSYKGRSSYYRPRTFRGPYRGYRGRNRPYSNYTRGRRPYYRSFNDRDDYDQKRNRRSTSEEQKWGDDFRDRSEKNHSDDGGKRYTPEEIPLPIDLPDTVPPGVDINELNNEM